MHMPEAPESTTKSTARSWLSMSSAPDASKVVGTTGNTPRYGRAVSVVMRPYDTGRSGVNRRTRVFDGFDQVPHLKWLAHAYADAEAVVRARQNRIHRHHHNRDRVAVSLGEVALHE